MSKTNDHQLTVGNELKCFKRLETKREFFILFLSKKYFNKFCDILIIKHRHKVMATANTGRYLLKK